MNLIAFFWKGPANRSVEDAISPWVPEFVKSGDDFVLGQDPYDKQDQGGKQDERDGSDSDMEF